MDDFLRVTALEDLMVSREDVEDVVSAPEGVNAMRSESESAGCAVPIVVTVFDRGCWTEVVGGSDAVTGTRLRFAVDRFGFLTAIASMLCAFWCLLLVLLLFLFELFSCPCGSCQADSLRAEKSASPLYCFC